VEQRPILVVDDDPVNCEVLRRILQRNQHSVVVAQSGMEALEHLRAGSTAIDLVLLDMRMPGMSGMETLKAIRSQYSATDLPVIMVTAEGDSATIVSALDSGANDYVTKPVELPVLSARVRTQLSQKRADQGLRVSQERYALAARGSNDGLWDLNLVSGELYLGARWKEMLGDSSSESVETLEFWSALVHPEDRARFHEAFEDHCQRKTAKVEGEFRVMHRDGTWRWVLIRGVAVWDGSGQATRIAGSQTDITESRAHDPLTGLPNRLHFRDKVTAALERQKLRVEDRAAVLFLDLDRFKTINDSLGHSAGDSMLVQLSNRLKSAIRTDRDTLARLGGDEFALLLSGFETTAELVGIAERLFKEINQPMNLAGQRVFPRASLGIAVSTEDVVDADELIHNADTAMYAAKATRKGSFSIFNAEMRELAQKRMSLESDLRRAIDQNDFELAFQPLVKLRTGGIVGFEALLRWEHPEKGTIAPNDFIPLVEATGLIVPLGAWALREAASQLVKWRNEFPGMPGLFMSVNISPLQLVSPGFCDFLAETLRQTGAPVEHLKLELTESVFLDPAMAETLEQVRSLGFPIKMDDFGTGYCSLGYLQRTRFDAIKIDKSFIAEIDSSKEAYEVVSTIISLGKSLNMRVVAEGVETESQLNVLRGLGCTYGQGFHFSKPVSIAAAQQLLAQQDLQLPGTG
jgi:diguanylate cyclase (GGDEF)-like protein/PAS domain S-box-containing protein